MTLMRLKGLKKYRVRDPKTGVTRVYCYHRATGTRLKEPFGTAAFAAELAALEQSVIPKPLAEEGSLGGLIDAYKRSPEFSELRPRTRADYDKVFTYLEAIWPMPIVEIDGAFVIELRDEAFRLKKRRFANYVVQVVRLLFAWGKPRRKGIDANPAGEVPAIKRPKTMARANRPWAPDEWAEVWSAASPQIRHVLALGMYALMRESDALAFTWEGVEMAHGAPYGVRWHQSKTGEVVSFSPAVSELLAELVSIRTENAARRTAEQTKRPNVIMLDGPEKGIVCLQRWGRPWTQHGFLSSFTTLRRDLEAAGKIKPGLTFHGLRHTGGKLLADRGADIRTIAVALGHRSTAMAEFYSREADREKLSRKAVVKLSDARKSRAKRTAAERNSV